METLQQLKIHTGDQNACERPLKVELNVLGHTLATRSVCRTEHVLPFLFMMLDCQSEDVTASVTVWPDRLAGLESNTNSYGRQPTGLLLWHGQRTQTQTETSTQSIWQHHGTSLQLCLLSSSIYPSGESGNISQIP